MYFVDLSNSDLCDRRIEMTIDLNCTSLDDALTNAAKLKDELKAPSARVFTYHEPEQYEAIEVAVIVKNGIARYRSSSLDQPRLLQNVTQHLANGEIVMPFKYLIEEL